VRDIGEASTGSNPGQVARPLGGVIFQNPGAFWFGAVATTVGVILHLPMYISGRTMGYHLAGMPMDTPMLIGMFLIIVGFASSFYGLYPPSAGPNARAVSHISVRALDEARITKTHVALLVVMAIALTIDVMKTTTLAFVAPGMALEYGLRSQLNPQGVMSVTYLPLSGITGTVLGSFIAGWLGDRIGRRATMLFGGITFIGTSICGAMPSYLWNLLMCFMMGLGVGGMLPIANALMADTIPARHRGWLMVLIGGAGAGAYVITGWLAVELVPQFSWRILWLLGAPTGLLLILLNRWIPESPRFLLANGRDAEARAVMERYGAKIVDAPSELEVEEGVTSHWTELVGKGLLSQTMMITVLGLGIGLVLFGFNLWIPTNLLKLGFSEVTADRLLRDAALIGFPFTLVVALMYGFWSSKKTVMLLTMLTATAMLVFAISGDAVVENRLLLYVLLVIPIWGISTVTALLTVYSSEIYPTHIRSHGSGLAAGASKLGGVLIIGLVAFGVAAPSIASTTLIGGIPMAVAALGILLFGVETRNRRLEEITAEEFNEFNVLAAPVEKTVVV
jgi:MFS transporter, putative metabolite:H+ symporter